MTAFDVSLDWRTHTVSAAPLTRDGALRCGLCAICGHPALMRDELGRPCHKVCAERVLTERNTAAAATYAAGSRPELVELPIGRLAIDTTGATA